ncbi:MAG: Rieske (2Fe-2S) protein [Anaerolineae bacterium]|nr:Rieske (2Fe-2S) protein [Anaerolineae bacterium]
MSKQIRIGSSADFPVGKLVKVEAEGTLLLVARVGDRLCAVQNRCTHMPLPLGGGTLNGNTITCPWHNSEFDLCSGENLDWVRGVAGIRLPGWSRKLMELGKKPAPLTTYAITETGNDVFLQMD